MHTLQTEQLIPLEKSDFKDLEATIHWSRCGSGHGSVRKAKGFSEGGYCSGSYEDILDFLCQFLNLVRFLNEP